MRLVCVDPARASEFWPYVRSLIYAAMKRGGLSSFQPVEASVLSGDAMLWLAWDGERVAAAAVSELHQTEWRKVCVVVACGAHLRPSGFGGLARRSAQREGGWVGLLDGIEDYAKAAGCSAMRIMGRKGWARVLEDYRMKQIVLEKDL